MSEHVATVRWKLAQSEFLKGAYSRAHEWCFDGGVTVPASSSPAAVRVPLSNPDNVDPEEAYVASISSCHMLTFLYVACRAGFEVLAYEDQAVGHMTKNERGVPWVSSVTLHPRVTWGAAGRPAPEVEAKLHHDAHAGCFIANSINTEILVEPVEA
jgi:organic hydroperoxide reductase OsmC/OhrA